MERNFLNVLISAPPEKIKVGAREFGSQMHRSSASVYFLYFRKVALGLKLHQSHCTK